MISQKYLDSPAQLAQSVERSAFNRVVVGSIPTLGVFFPIFCTWFSTPPTVRHFPISVSDPFAWLLVCLSNLSTHQHPTTTTTAYNLQHTHTHKHTHIRMSSSSSQNMFAHELPEVIAASQSTNSNSQFLLDRLGGEDVLEAVVEKFYDAVVKEKELSPFFDRVNMPLLMAHQKRFMTVAFTEIPLDFDVKGYIIERHYRLFDKGVNERHFDLVIQHLVDTLVSFGVSQDLIAQAGALLAPFREVFETTKREDIMEYLKDSVGKNHKNRIEEARIARQKEKEEKERKASRNKNKKIPTNRRGSMGSVASGLDSIQE